MKTIKEGKDEDGSEGEDEESIGARLIKDQDVLWPNDFMCYHPAESSLLENNFPCHIHVDRAFQLNCVTRLN